MASEPYSTAAYPYPVAMWDEAYDHLLTYQGWETVLLVCPNPAEAEATAVSEMAARGLANATALVLMDEFSGVHIIRISALVHIAPHWDHLVSHFAEGRPAALLALEGDPATLMDDARAAMAERGFNVGVGHSLDPISGMSILRIEPS